MKKIIIFSSIGILLLVAILFFMFMYSGGAIEEIPKPTITYENGTAVITADQINYLIHYLGGEKLRKIPFTSNYPKIEILLTQKQEYFTSEIHDGIQTTKTKISNPDIQIRLNENTLADLINAEKAQEATTKAIGDDKIGVTLYSGSTELFLKGYFKIYDKIKP